MSFLKELKEETSVRSRLRNLLVLLLRCLAVITMVMAFAQPFISKKGGASTEQPKFVSIFVDNSLSMTALNEEVDLLERSKETARSIVRAFRKDDQFNIFTNQLDYRSRSLLDREAALSLIDDIEYEPLVLKLNEIINFQNEIFTKSKGAREQISYLISDFQEGMYSESFEPDSLTSTYIIPIRSSIPANVGIDSVWFERPVLIQNQSSKLFVALTNHSDSPVENTRLSFTELGENKPLGQINIPAKGTIVDTISMSFETPGYQHLSIQISDYPVQFDDTFYVSFNVERTFKVLHVIDKNKLGLERSFKSSSQLELNSVGVSQLDYAKINKYDLIVVDELIEMSSGLQSTLDAYLKEGGNLFFIPKPDLLSQSTVSFLAAYQIRLNGWDTTKREVGRVNTESYIFSDVFENAAANFYLPGTSGSYAISAERANESVMSYRNGMDYLSAFEVGLGNLFVLSAPLRTDFNNLTDNPSIFVPMVYKMASSSNEHRETAYTIGTDDLIKIRLDAEAVDLDGVFALANDNTEFIPAQQFSSGQLELNVYGQVKQAGTYKLMDPLERKVAEVAYNYDRSESNLDYLTDTELEAQFKGKASIIQYNLKADLTDLVQKNENGLRLWTLFLVLTLLFLLGESLVLRFWKIN